MDSKKEKLLYFTDIQSVASRKWGIIEYPV